MSEPRSWNEVIRDDLLPMGKTPDPLPNEEQTRVEAGELKACPKCDGQGGTDGYDQNGEPTHSKVTCSACCGTGDARRAADLGDEVMRELAPFLADEGLSGQKLNSQAAKVYDAAIRALSAWPAPDLGDDELEERLRQFRPEATLIHQAADRLRVYREALGGIGRETGKGFDGFIDWQRCVDRIQMIARTALLRSRG